MTSSAMPDIKTLAATGSWGRGKVYDSIAETIGNTPLVRLRKVAAASGSKADVLLKLEFFNPLSSVKDRIGVSMIDTLESLGHIVPGRSTLPATWSYRIVPSELFPFRAGFLIRITSGI